MRQRPLRPEAGSGGRARTVRVPSRCRLPMMALHRSLLGSLAKMHPVFFMSAAVGRSGRSR